ncbi:arylsulfatase [Rhodohalobacter sulfatireducens]|uniref:Arylsulfatase n=1 Tax=Rhodohalobacter sulfatireducens TaxID=2911366 RepID=A0ABS9K8R8_9BACT|nr:arylsulfatase [Rhodohalobacter sulfatireducens]MCG2587248.1 arylsulfatase [Rhodohalobacter sulfatireducens]
MNRKQLLGTDIFCICLISIFLLTGYSQTVNGQTEKPNIIYILADDLGYGELGVYGQEKIETPNIDALAEAGMKFTNHYSGAPVCAPARYMLMTGKHPGNAFIRSNHEWGERGDVWSFENMAANPMLEGQFPIPGSTETVGKLLQKAGYKTGAIGKWGLGAPFTEGVPTNQGFDFFFGYNGQRQAHTYYPIYLWRNDTRVALRNQLVPPHQDLPDSADPHDPESYAIFHDQPDYSADLMHDETIGFIERNQNMPFFLYLPTPIPHVSLQAPERWINYYREKFGEEEPYTQGSYVPAQYPKATYAAMISYMDEKVGEIVEKLKELGLYENTLIMFSSDNGPTYAGGVDPDYFRSAGPFPNYVNGESRIKGHVYEGGIRVPMIATWEGVIPAGSSTNHISAFWDVLPTLTEVAEAESPEGIDGISFLPTLKGHSTTQKKHDYLYWEFPSYGGQQAVRMGKWKGIRKNIIADGNLEIELYNLEEDIREENNVAAEHPEIVNQIREIMKEEHTVPELSRFKMEALGDYD